MARPKKRKENVRGITKDKLVARYKSDEAKEEEALNERALKRGHLRMWLDDSPNDPRID